MGDAQGNRFVGIANQGATCYMNSVLQSLYHIPLFRKTLHTVVSDMRERSERVPPVLSALHSLFAMLHSKDTTVRTDDFTKSLGWTRDQSFVQNDAHEFQKALFQHFTGSMEGALVELFQGMLKTTVVYNNDPSTNAHEHEVPFLDLQLQVEGCSGVISSLDKYVSEERINSQEHGSEDATRNYKVKKFPHILQLHLNRFKHAGKQGQGTKINDRYEFPLELDLDRENRKYLSEEAAQDVPNLYSLHSVVVHEGHIGGGHYWAYIRPTLHEWYKFEDGNVTEEDFDTTFVNQFGGDAKDSNAYMLVYIRKSETDRIIHHVEEMDMWHTLANPAEAANNEDLLGNQVAYHTRTIQFLGQTTRIILENENGPCALLALCNVLLLKDELRISNDLHISQNELISLVHGLLASNNKDAGNVEELKKNIQSARDLLPRLATELEVNCKVTSINGFDPTPELGIFHLLNIPLYHGCVVDPEDNDTVAAIGSKSYNTPPVSDPNCPVKKIGIGDNEEDRVKADMKASELSTYSKYNAGGASSSEGQPSDHVIKSRDAIKEGPTLKEGEPSKFLVGNMSQLTVYGLNKLHQDLKEGELCVLFRNNQYSTLYKRNNGELYVLVTDKAFMGSSPVWDKLNQVSGNTNYVTYDFKEVVTIGEEVEDIYRKGNYSGIQYTLKTFKRHDRVLWRGNVRVDVTFLYYWGSVRFPGHEDGDAVFVAAKDESEAGMICAYARILTKCTVMIPRGYIKVKDEKDTEQVLLCYYPFDCLCEGDNLKRVLEDTKENVNDIPGNPNTTITSLMKKLTHGVLEMQEKGFSTTWLQLDIAYVWCCRTRSIGVLLGDIITEVNTPDLIERMNADFSRAILSFLLKENSSQALSFFFTSPPLAPSVRLSS